MQRTGDEVHLNTQEASGGETPHIVRKVLFASLLLAIMAMSIVWISHSTNDSESSHQATTAEQHALGG